MTLPLVSIIIVNYNGKDYLDKCLESLLKIDYKNIEIIVIDNHSNDGSTEFVENKYPKVLIKILEKNLGFAEPNNIGAKIANGELLLFLNNDTMVTDSFLGELVRAIKHDSKIVICQSLLLRPDNTIDSSGDFVDIYGRAYSMRKKVSNISNILSARGACMLIKKDFFLEMGGFDKKFFVSFEDVDLGWRTWLMGYKVILVPTSVVYHHTSKTVEKIRPLIQFHGAKNTLIIKLTNFEPKYLIKSIFVLVLTAISLKLFGKSLIKEPEENLNLPSTLTMAKAVSWVLKNWKYVVKKRNQVNSSRKFSTADLIKLDLIRKI